MCGGCVLDVSFSPGFNGSSAPVWEVVPVWRTDCTSLDSFPLTRLSAATSAPPEASEGIDQGGGGTTDSATPSSLQAAADDVEAWKLQLGLHRWCLTHLLPEDTVDSRHPDIPIKRKCKALKHLKRIRSDPIHCGPILWPRRGVDCMYATSSFPSDAKPQPWNKTRSSLRDCPLATSVVAVQQCWQQALLLSHQTYTSIPTPLYEIGNVIRAEYRQRYSASPRRSGSNTPSRPGISGVSGAASHPAEGQDEVEGVEGDRPNLAQPGMLVADRVGRLLGELIAQAASGAADVVSPLQASNGLSATEAIHRAPDVVSALFRAASHHEQTRLVESVRAACERGVPRGSAPPGSLLTVFGTLLADFCTYPARYFGIMRWIPLLCVC